MRDVLVARLICSDTACAAELEAEAPTLAELETLICDCGCALEVIAWPDEAPSAGAEVVHLALHARVQRRAA
jgi:hypothetical protein